MKPITSSSQKTDEKNLEVLFDSAYSQTTNSSL